MFEIPTQVEGLMKEYRELIERALKRRNKTMTHSFLVHLSQHVRSIHEDDLQERVFEEYQAELWFGDEPDSLTAFVEERIGEEFVVLPGLEDKVFCLYEVEDFLFKSEKKIFDEPKNSKEVTIEKSHSA